MAWSKVKNIVILILLMMNLVLAGFSVNRMMQARQTRTQARAEAIAFLQTGNYIRCQTDLLKSVSTGEKAIVERFLWIKNGGKIEFKEMSEQLFLWSGNWIEKAK